jgi:hypothetical protein
LSRNNQSRLAGKQPAFSVEPVPAMPQTHISISIPTEFVDLPSGGLFYPPNHPLHRKETIEIKFMTAKEEDLLASEQLIRKGIVLDRLIQSLIVDKQINPSSLLICDRNAILIAARNSGYGQEYEANVICPFCNEQQQIVHDLSTFQYEAGESVEGLQISERGTCLVTLPKSNKVVEFRLLTGYDETNNTTDKNKNAVISSAITDQLKSVIISIDGDDDLARVNLFASNMPAFDSRFLRKVIRKVTPKTDLKFDLKCSECEAESVVEVPIGVRFFWPDA